MPVRRLDTQGTQPLLGESETLTLSTRRHKYAPGSQLKEVQRYSIPAQNPISRGRNGIMPGPRPKYPIELSEMQVTQLTQRSLSYTAPYAEVQRARILLLAHHHPTW